MELELDKYQLAAVLTDAKNVVVLAAPGSGKTRTLTGRFIRMVEDMNIHSSQIALITFTRYAANEIKARINRKTMGNAYCGTIHGFALQIIEQYGHSRGWENDWLTILDQEETELEEREVLKDLGYWSEKSGWKSCTMMEWLLYRLDKLGNAAQPRHAAKFDRVWTAIMDQLHAENTLTFDMIISEAIGLLNLPAVREDFRSQCKHILLDEGQDTDSQQWALIKLIEPETFFVVADVDQTVYQWRGARPDLFLKYMEGAEVFRLPLSYRFGLNIAAPANSLIKYNSERVPGEITGAGAIPGEVVQDTIPQLATVADLVADELAKGTRPQDIAVLARRHSTLELIERSMPEGMPRVHVGSDMDVAVSPQLRACKGYLRLAVNKHDKRAFMAIAAAEQLTTTQIWSLRAKALTLGTSLVDAYGEKLPEWMPAIRERLVGKGQDKIFEAALDYLTVYAWRDALSTPKEVVRSLAMDSIQDRLRNVGNHVLLTTVHAAKGLEWPVVMVVGLNEGEFPSPRSVKEGRMEEERRLLYVAITRAKKRLYLLSDQQRSQFVYEIANANLSGSLKPEGDKHE